LGLGLPEMAPVSHKQLRKFENSQTWPVMHQACLSAICPLNFAVANRNQINMEKWVVLQVTEN